MELHRSESPPSQNTPTYELSGWWRRVGAAVIDNLIVGFIAVPIQFLIGHGPDLSGDANASLRLEEAGWDLLVSGSVYALIVVAVMGYTNGRTIGKMATGIRVVREDGRPVGYGFAAVRELLVKFGLFGGVLGMITIYIATLVDALWPLWDGGNRALHDMIVKTRVVRTGVTLRQTEQNREPAMPSAGFENPVPED